MTFKNTSTIKKFISQCSNPSMAFFDSLMSTISKGIRIGKLKIAINVKLLLAFDAIAETIVNKEENPKLPNSKVSMNKGIS